MSGTLLLCHKSKYSTAYWYIIALPFSVTVTQTSGSASGSAFPIGNTTVSWEAEDLAGNTVSASMTVTVLDNEFPDITAPANIKVSTDPGLTTAV